jgi:mannitol-specific phosphotransferase system IIBC component
MRLRYNLHRTHCICRSKKEIIKCQTISATNVKTVILACEAGMGSSLMSVNSLKKKLKAAQVTDVTVVHKPVREIPADAQVVVVHKGLAKLPPTRRRTQSSWRSTISSTILCSIIS